MSKYAELRSVAVHFKISFEHKLQKNTHYNKYDMIGSFYKTYYNSIIWFSAKSYSSIFKHCRKKLHTTRLTM